MTGLLILIPIIIALTIFITNYNSYNRMRNAKNRINLFVKQLLYLKEYYIFKEGNDRKEKFVIVRF